MTNNNWKNASERIEHMYNIDKVDAESLLHSNDFRPDDPFVANLLAMYGRVDKQARSLIKDCLSSVHNIYGPSINDTQFLRVTLGLTFFDEHAYNVCKGLGYSDENIATIFNTTENLVVAMELMQVRKNCFTEDGQAIIPEDQAYHENKNLTK